MANQRRFFNMYLTSAISVALVLFLIGLLGVLILTTRSVVQRVRENITFTVVVQPNAGTKQVEQLSSLLRQAPYAKQVHYISQQQALQEHIEALGEDPTRYLGYNPLRASFEVNPTETYANVDSIAAIEQQLHDVAGVDEVLYQKDVVGRLNTNLSQAYVGITIVTLILLFIALALITNTIRLQIYSKRFIIHTMFLVGATGWMIKRPFIRRNVGAGLCAGILALGILTLAVYYLNRHLGIILFPLTTANILLLVGFVLTAGVVITLLASLVATNHYLYMNTDNMNRV